MRYLKAAVVGLLIAFVGGVAAGLRECFLLRGGPDAGPRASGSVESIAVALNCAALFTLVCVPLAVVVQFARGRYAGKRPL